MADWPVIDDAPGLVWRALKNTMEARWLARTDLVRRGFRPRIVRLWAGKPEECGEIERDWISDRCQALQGEMLVYSRGGAPKAIVYDGTLRRLATCYTSDPDSTYHDARPQTRTNYDYLLRRVLNDVWTSQGAVQAIGDELVADIHARTLLRWHELWSDDGAKVAMGHAMIAMLRTLFSFGATLLRDPECDRLCGTLHKMRFPMAKPRSERLTAEHAVAIIAEAHRQDRHSIALAQALQFECLLRQKDVIGEWVPQSEKGTSDVTMGSEKWLWGARWSEIRDLVLMHTTSKRQKEIVINLRLAPMIMAEFERIGPLPVSGPMVVCEVRGRPYRNYEFRADWRKIARAAGVPDAVRNMDSRAGGISEATDAGAELEHVRHAATHSDIGMTQRYSRGGVEKTATVMKIRSAHRAKKGQQ